jgi:hypothetical protein
MAASLPPATTRGMTRRSSMASVLLLGMLGVLASCNRRPREVDFDLTLRPDPHAPRPTIVADPIDVYVPGNTLLRVLVHNQSSSVHNFVLLQPGHIDEVLSASTAAPGGPIAEAAHAAVLARSSWVAPGQTQVVAFVAPPAGYYEFTCTCGTASHTSPLRGKLVVQ